MPSHSEFPRLTLFHLVLVVGLALAGAACESRIQQTSSLQTTVSTRAAPKLAEERTAAAEPTLPVVLVPTPGGGFDYFILALSWSPDYCAANAARDPQQCGVGRKLGFVLHGLWPQYLQGYPSDCSTAPLPQAVKADFAGLYPNETLFEHEWGKHGTCAGMDARAYLELAQRLKQSVAIPASFQSPSQPFRQTPGELRQAFEGANPGLGDASLELSCSGTGRYLKELYVCFGKDGLPAACGKDVHKDSLKSCARPDFLVRSTR